MPDRKCFIDTNIWLYAFIRSDDVHKTELAKRLIESCKIATSSQVINEMCVNLLKKTDIPTLPHLKSMFPGLFPATLWNYSVKLQATLKPLRWERAWKGFDWDTLNRLHEKGFISDPVGKTKSVGMSEAGFIEARNLFERHFASKAKVAEIHC